MARSRGSRRASMTACTFATQTYSRLEAAIHPAIVSTVRAGSVLSIQVPTTGNRTAGGAVTSGSYTMAAPVAPAHAPRARGLPGARGSSTLSATRTTYARASVYSMARMPQGPVTRTVIDEQ